LRSRHPQSARCEHLDENLRVFDFELEKSEMRALSSLGKKLRFVEPDRAPDYDV
jgi:diketogulonate reductase-like aldo/keto reductase